MKPVIVELKSDADLKQVVEISSQNLLDLSRLSDKDYLYNIKKSGFFIANNTLKDLRNDKNKIILGFKDNDQIVAFIWVTVFTDNHQYDWFDQNKKDEIFGKKIYYLKRIGVAKIKQGQGLGGKLLESLINTWLDDKSIKYLVASVADSPVRNLASIGFNLKYGFEKVAISPKVSYSVFKEYQCLLFAKKIH